MTTLDESFLVANLAADLDDVACASIFEDFEGLAIGRCQSQANHTRKINATDLLHRHTSRKQLDKVTRLQNCSRVESLPGRLDSHATLDQVQSARDSKLLQRSRDNRPCFLQVDFTVFGEKRSERRFLCKTSTKVVIGFECFLLLSQICGLAKARKNSFEIWKNLYAVDALSTCQYHPCPRASRHCV